jgi:serine protease Do
MSRVSESLKSGMGLISQMELGEGFIITHINKVPIEDPETLADILTKIRGAGICAGCK